MSTMTNQSSKEEKRGPCISKYAHSNKFTSLFFLYLFQFRYIDTTGVRCLNERDAKSILKVFRPWDRRLEKDGVKNIFH